MKMTITTALRKYLRALEPASPSQDVLAAVAVSLAARLDRDEGGSMTAAVARELRATLTALAPSVGDADRELAELLQGLSR